MTERSVHVVVLAVGGLVAAATAAVSCARTGSWWLFPATLSWAYGMATAAGYDAVTRRIPTRIVWPAAGVTAALLMLAGLATGSWQPLLTGIAAALAAGLILASCWRFAGLGFGDVRLGVLGGLGLGQTGGPAITAGVAAFAVAAAAWAAVVYLRTRDRKATFPVGPALTLGFLTAAVL